jgi:hypothetical protein
MASDFSVAWQCLHISQREQLFFCYGSNSTPKRKMYDFKYYINTKHCIFKKEHYDTTTLATSLAIRQALHTICMYFVGTSERKYPPGAWTVQLRSQNQSQSCSLD